MLSILFGMKKRTGIHRLYFESSKVKRTILLIQPFPIENCREHVLYQKLEAISDIVEIPGDLNNEDFLELLIEAIGQ